MILWRISRHRDLSGIGGLRAAGRWHHAGHPIVYMTETPASALCVHTSANDVPPEFTLLKIDGPNVETPVIEIDTLPQNWQTQLEVTRDLGTSWLERTRAYCSGYQARSSPRRPTFCSTHRTSWRRCFGPRACSPIHLIFVSRAKQWETLPSA
jgi:hypothetical protein